MKKVLEKFFKGFCLLDEVDSKYNGRIRVFEDFFGQRRILVGGLTQSGKAVADLWTVGLKELSSKNIQIEKCLLLGVGAGSVVGVINKLSPGIEIAGIEIDEEMINIGKKHFGLDKFGNFKAIIGNAIEKIDSFPNESYDLILVDMYLGSKVPEGLEADSFLSKLKSLLKPDGVVIFNRLYYDEKIIEAEKFSQKLEQFFSLVEAKKVRANKLFLCQKLQTIK